MGNYEEIFRRSRVKHNLASDHVYMQRYKRESKRPRKVESNNDVSMEVKAPESKLHDEANRLNLMDHYRYLCQLLPICRVLDKKVRDPNYSLPLPDELKELGFLADKIEKDIYHIERQLAYRDRVRKILGPTKEYVDFLAALKSPKDDAIIHANFCTRILADLDGGRRQREYIRDLYTRCNIKPSRTWSCRLNSGLSMYYYQKDSSSMLMKVKDWLDTLPAINDDDETALNAAFDCHIKIFDELEKTRPRFTMPVSTAQAVVNFFNPKIAGIVDATCAAAANFKRMHTR